MLFARLEIKNFRSVAEPGITVEFDDKSNLCALVGANNSGKTNILDAMALVVGIRNSQFYNYRISQSDFYNQDSSKVLYIKLTLRKPLPYRDVYQQSCTIDGFVYTAKEHKSGNNKGEIKTDHYCFGSDAKGKPQSPLLDSSKIYKTKKAPEDDIDYAKLPVWARDHTHKLGTAYFLDIQNLETFFSTAGLGPLGRLFKVYKDDFQNPKTIYEFGDGSEKKKMPSREAFERAARRITDILKTDKLTELEKHLSQNVSKYLGLASGKTTSISLGLPDAQELFEELTVLKIQESQNLRPIEIRNLGSGYLSLFRLATLRSLAEIQEKEVGIYLIEEPEIYLHPHLRKFFHKTLKPLSDSGHQVIFSTHSEDFVDLNDYKSIVRVNKQDDSTKAYQVPSGLALDFDHVELKIKSKGNGEVYFARRVLLTEGQDDKTIFSDVLAKKGLDCEAESISVLDCGSKGQITDYIRLLNALHINCFAIFDTDIHGGTAKTTQKIKKELNDDPKRFHGLPDSLEAALKTTKTDRNTQHLLSIITPLDYSQISSQFPEIAEAAEAFVSWLS
jgi:putative ATP-dependent endonuclease of OLD family